MSKYYKDVYLRRVNRFGTNLQERIINKKEHDFSHFVRKSPNRVTVFIQDYQFEGVLQSKTYDEIETIDYFLTYKSIPLDMGTILKIRNIRDKDQYTYWIIVARDNFTSAGYYRYTVVKLDREIRWITEDGFIFKALAHISGAGSGGTNHRLISSVKVQDTIVYKPNQVLTVVLKDNEEIERGVRINIGGMVWKISGLDRVTNPGVSYITLEQDYYDHERDEEVHLEFEPDGQDGLADGPNLKYWNFESSAREEYVQENGKEWIQLRVGQSIPISFSAYYYGRETESPLNINIKNNQIVSYNSDERTLLGIAVGETQIRVQLQDSPDTYKDFNIKIIESDQDTETFSVECVGRAKYGIPTTFISKIPFELITDKDYIVVKDLGLITKNEQQFYGLEITISNIEKNLSLNFVAKDDDSKTYTKIIEVESPWIGGYSNGSKK